MAIQVEPVAGGIGAEINGVNLAGALSNSDAEGVYHAFLEHHVLFFRGQTLEPDTQMSAAQLFGEPDLYPFIEGMAGFPEVIEIIKSETDAANFGGSWHSDTAYLPEPAKCTMLYAVDVPDAGGDTLFASTEAAYDALSSGMQAMLDGLIGVNSSDNGYGGSRAKAMQRLDVMGDTYNEGAESYINEHPIVRTHPETGRKSLYISRSHTSHFKDMTAAESKPLIDYLSAHITRPEFTCRMRWQPGSVAVWDNRSAQHFALNDYVGKRRHMRRITMKGDRPF